MPTTTGRAPAAGFTLSVRVVKPFVFLACLTPYLLLVWRYQHHQTGANPSEYVEHFTGDWTLRLLLISLCITPLRQITGVSGLIRYRRMLGLFAFFYGMVHSLAYVSLDKGFFWDVIWDDITHRTFYILGIIALGLMIPLVLTSTAASIRWLGGKRWRWLHRLVYVSAAAGVTHYLLQGKTIRVEPVLYCIAASILLGYRLWAAQRKPA